MEWMENANFSIRFIIVDFAAKLFKYHSYCFHMISNRSKKKHYQEKNMTGEDCIPSATASIWHLN